VPWHAPAYRLRVGIRFLSSRKRIVGITMVDRDFAPNTQSAYQVVPERCQCDARHQPGSCHRRGCAIRLLSCSELIGIGRPG
jgi:hypothetical protein